MPLALTYDEVKALEPCSDRWDRVSRLLGGKCDKRASAAFKSAMPQGIQRWAEATGAFDSTQTVSITGHDLAAIDGRVC